MFLKLSMGASFDAGDNERDKQDEALVIGSTDVFDV